MWMLDVFHACISFFWMNWTKEKNLLGIGLHVKPKLGERPQGLGCVKLIKVTHPIYYMIFRALIYHTLQAYYSFPFVEPYHKRCYLNKTYINNYMVACHVIIQIAIIRFFFTHSKFVIVMKFQEFYLVFFHAQKEKASLTNGNKSCLPNLKTTLMMTMGRSRLYWKLWAQTLEDERAHAC